MKISLLKSGNLLKTALLPLAVLAASTAPAQDDWGPFTGSWKRYDNNPILPKGEEESHYIPTADRGDYEILQGGMTPGPDSVIQHDGKLWMFIYHHEDAGTKLAVSEDGVEWEYVHDKPILKATEPWEGDRVFVKATEVINGKVYLYYTANLGIEERMGVARNTSSDLMTTDWKKYPDNPVFTKEDVSAGGKHVIPGSVVEDNGTYYLFYDNSYDYGHAEHPNEYTVSVASAKDGIHFKPLADNILVPASESNRNQADWWESGGVCQPAVRKVDGWWYMIYDGFARGRWERAFGLARARTPEGPWEKYSNQAIFVAKGTKNYGAPKEWDVFLQHPCPVKVNGEWRLYFAGCSQYHYWGQVGMATKGDPQVDSRKQ